MLQSGIDQAARGVLSEQDRKKLEEEMEELVEDGALIVVVGLTILNQHHWQRRVPILYYLHTPEGKGGGTEIVK